VPKFSHRYADNIFGCWDYRGLIEGCLCFGWNHSNLSNSSGENRVPEFQAKSASSEDVLLDCASAPRATVDGHSLRRHALQVEPPARHPVHSLINHPNHVKGVSRCDQHTVAGAEILLSHRFERSCFLNPGRKRLRDGSQNRSSQTCCSVAIATSTPTASRIQSSITSANLLTGSLPFGGHESNGSVRIPKSEV
jgi:hypothetical protein